MKKYLFSGGIATLLILSACGTNENDSEDNAEAEETDIRVTELEEENEILASENETLKEQVETLESNLNEAIEQSSQENASIEDEELEEEPAADNGIIKESGEQETVKLDSINLTVGNAAIGQIEEVSSGDAMMFMHQDFEAGETVDVIIIGYNVENTSDDPRNLFLKQAEIVTSNGHQLQPEMLMAEGLNDQMQGAVNQSGSVPYLLPDNSGEDIEWIDIILPVVSDNDLNFYTEEQKLRVEFN